MLATGWSSVCEIGFLFPSLSLIRVSREFGPCGTAAIRHGTGPPGYPTCFSAVHYS